MFFKPVCYGLQAIESTNRYVVDDCFTDMLSHWLSRTPSWSKLVEALQSPVIDCKGIAGGILSSMHKAKETVV